MAAPNPLLYTVDRIRPGRGVQRSRSRTAILNRILRSSSSPGNFIGDLDGTGRQERCQDIIGAGPCRGTSPAIRVRPDPVDRSRRTGFTG